MRRQPLDFMTRRTLISIGIASGVLLLAVVGVIFLRMRATQDLSLPITQEPAVQATPPVPPTESSASTTDPFARPLDTDGDGLSDAAEQKVGTDPTKQDTDGDGFTDFEEVVLMRMDPLKPDLVSSNGLRSPTLSPLATSTISASTPPSAVSPTSSPGSADPDRDGLTNDQELQLGSDPNNPDTDGDGLSDKDEVVDYLTNPLKKDTDGDGFDDATEIKKGYNPLGPGKCARVTCIP